MLVGKEVPSNWTGDLNVTYREGNLESALYVKIFLIIHSLANSLFNHRNMECNVLKA